jgi:membrane-bound inhibitor of C-type lysozyme
MQLRISLVTVIMFTALTTAAHATKATYTCSGGTRLTATFSEPAILPGNVVISIAGSPRAIKLQQVISADGGRYADGDMEFWIKGKGATLNRKGVSQTCKTR